MESTVVTKDPRAVASQVEAIYSELFPQGEPGFVPAAFGWTEACFTGRYRDYLPIDARYHDFEHTLQGLLCLARLLRGRHLAGAEPRMDERRFQLALMAILLHDTGYLKHRTDEAGTGAKYTITHVARSAEFAAGLLAEKQFAPTEIRAVQNMIRCTALNAALKDIPFQSDVERVLGCAVATADLLGQMAAEDYVDKLPELFEEFSEAAEFTGNENHFIASFSSGSDLTARTPEFWEKFVLPKLNGDLAGVYRFLSDPYPDGPNLYLDRIAGNMRRIANG